MERLSIDFKGPLPTSTNNPYLLTVIDEYSRFPFAFACPNMSSSTVIKCLDQLFTLCGTPGFVHSDRGASFMSRELKEYLSQKGIATSRTTPYHPIGNGQVERYNGIVWKNVRLSLKSANLPDSKWEMVLPDALHSIRSLLSTATNTTPHERFFGFQRRSTHGTSLPTWLQTPGPVLLRRYVRRGKNDPLVDQVELKEANPTYAHIKYRDGRESTVSLRDLAPWPQPIDKANPATLPLTTEATGHTLVPEDLQPAEKERLPAEPEEPAVPPAIRRSSRNIKPPSRYGFEDE